MCLPCVSFALSLARASHLNPFPPLPPHSSFSLLPAAVLLVWRCSPLTRATARLKCLLSGPAVSPSTSSTLLSPFYPHSSLSGTPILLISAVLCDVTATKGRKTGHVDRTLWTSFALICLALHIRQAIMCLVSVLVLFRVTPRDTILACKLYLYQRML